MKKKYENPMMEVVETESLSILSGSSMIEGETTTGSTGSGSYDAGNAY